ncbi:MAG: methyltransferase [Chitinophagales bacterium]|nr:MAG: methyltransferase [Chitinophagales bacterium]
MRIIGGSLKGRRFHPPRSLPVRPTTDFSREGIFNILSHHRNLHQVRALDLFAGTGSISYELASRGCPLVIAVDNNRNCIRYIQETSTKLGIDAIEAIQEDALEFLEYGVKQFDLIFADPPYTFPNTEKIIESIFFHNRLSQGGWFILEHSPRLALQQHPHFWRQCKYGSSMFTFFQ